MGQQLHIRYKRQRRKQWVQRKTKADKAKAEKAKSKPAVAKTENTVAPA
jgi:hypothetical protein